MHRPAGDVGLDQVAVVAERHPDEDPLMQCAGHLVAAGGDRADRRIPDADVGRGAGLERADLGAEPERLGGAAGRRVQRLPGRQPLARERLTAWKALHAATRGAATALGLESEIGSLEVGSAADVCVWDAAVGSVATRRAAVARTLHERVFAWMTLGDERNLVASFVAGRVVHVRDSSLRSE